MYKELNKVRIVELLLYKMTVLFLTNNITLILYGS